MIFVVVFFSFFVVDIIIVMAKRISFYCGYYLKTVFSIWMCYQQNRTSIRRKSLIWLKYFSRDCATLKLIIFQVKFAVVGFGGQMILTNNFHQQRHSEKTSLDFFTERSLIRWKSPLMFSTSSRTSKSLSKVLGQQAAWRQLCWSVASQLAQLQFRFDQFITSNVTMIKLF